MELLLDVTTGLAAATTADAVVRVLTRKGIAALGAVTGGVWLCDAERKNLRMVGFAPVSADYAQRWIEVPLDGDTPMSICVYRSEALFIDSLDDYRARFPASFERVKGVLAPESSYALLPLTVDDNDPPMGGLAVTYDRAHAIEATGRTLLHIIARQCALSLKRIELLEAEHAARLEAEEATRAREEILAVVSHDLRNPLGTIMMGVSTLQALVEPGDPKGEKVKTIADRIQRQSDRMARLIDDVVDFAGIQAGTLAVKRAPTAPDAIISSTAELLGAIAQERGIGFSVDVAAGLPNVDVDRERAVQVLSNLLANALKVTTKGGRVAIGALGGADEVVFFVRDSGPGIEAAELPRLFERYWRSKKSTYKGAGLGLSIARGIVEAHSGRIWAESQVGVGSTFFFTLTPRA
jgi:signal transduction histidine kinase